MPNHCSSGITADLSGLVRCFTSSPPAPTLETAKALKEIDMSAILQAASHPSPRVATDLLLTRQFCALYTKNPSLSGTTEQTRREAAVKKFLDCERYQRLVSKRLRHYLYRWNRMPDLVGKALCGARYDLFRLLGPAPTGRDIVETVERARFGPGSVGGIARNRSYCDVTPYGKLSPDTQIQVTSDCLVRWTPLIKGEFRAWLDARQAQVVTHNKGITVPKDCDVDRFIAVEPYLNSYIQLGQMDVLSKYLRRWGVDISDQSWNQALARNASYASNGVLDGTATVDLSSASDSVNFELVRWLLPPGWFDYINSTRCPVCKIGDTEVVLEKFSSMGNGVTFPLETLIFSSFIRSVRRLTGDESSWACYGDDIIIGNRSVLLLMEVLRFVGFKTNEKKTFIVGAFRESCGEDFLDGHGVRPIYLKSELNDPAIYAFHNSAQRRGWPLNRMCEFARGLLRDPLVGPSLTPNGDCDTHLVAPLHVLKRDSRVHLKWRSDLQTWSCSFVALHRRSRKVTWREKRTEALRSYYAALGFGMLSGPHPVRASAVVYFHAAVTTTNIYWLGEYDLCWYSGG